MTLSKIVLAMLAGAAITVASIVLLFGEVERQPAMLCKYLRTDTVAVFGCYVKRTETE